jgi:hypothetical protein
MTTRARSSMKNSAFPHPKTLSNVLRLLRNKNRSSI